MIDQELIYVAGHSGLAGSAICRALKRRGVTRLLTETHRNLDLTQERSVDRFFDRTQPTVVILAAAKVGGIIANSTKPAEFILSNLQIQTNVIDACHRYGVRKLVFLGSSCIYPRHAEQPMRERDLLSGMLESTNKAYAVAKLAGVTMCQAYREQYGLDAISLLPTNLYGPNDNYDPVDSHVIPGLLRRMHDAKLANKPEFTIWGSGRPRREFLHADDFADAVCVTLESYSDSEPINIGCGADMTIAELAHAVREVVDYRGQLVFDTSKPDGMPRKLLDVSKIRALGWQPRIALADGLRATYDIFREKCAA